MKIPKTTFQPVEYFLLMAGFSYKNRSHGGTEEMQENANATLALTPPQCRTSTTLSVTLLGFVYIL